MAEANLSDATELLGILREANATAARFGIICF